MPCPAIASLRKDPSMVTPDPLVKPQHLRMPQAGKLDLPGGRNALVFLSVVAEANIKDEPVSSDDIALAAGMHGRGSEATVRSLCARLAKAGWLVRDEINKKPSAKTGCPVGVWYLSEEGAKQFGLDHGWKARKARRKTKTFRPVNETPDERRQRLEREAIKRAEEEYTENLRGANEFRRDVKKLRELTGISLHLLETMDRYACPSAAQEALIELLDYHITKATEAAEALRKNEPTPVALGLYKVLGVKVEATAATIKKAYWELARKHHPDIGGDDTKFREIAHAYAVLSDSEKRRLYNATGRG